MDGSHTSSIGLEWGRSQFFVKTVIKEEKIPFELSAKEPDDFYNEANIRHLEELKRLDDEGKLHFVSKTWEELKAMEK